MDNLEKISDTSDDVDVYQFINTENIARYIEKKDFIMTRRKNSDDEPIYQGRVYDILLDRGFIKCHNKDQDRCNVVIIDKYDIYCKKNPINLRKKTAKLTKNDIFREMLENTVKKLANNKNV